MESLKVTAEQTSEFLLENPLWSLKENKLHREFVFKDFISAFGFMTQIAIVSESANHHPQWSNSYKKVVVDLTTHELNEISIKDLKLAKVMDNIAEKLM